MSDYEDWKARVAERAERRRAEREASTNKSSKKTKDNSK